MLSQKRLVLGFFSVALLLMLSGCAQITVHSTVTADETVEDYDVQINMTRQAYGYFENSVEEDGYDSVREYFESSANGSAAEDVEFSQEFNGDQVSMNLHIGTLDPSNTSAINVQQSDGTMTYADRTFYNESALGEPESELGQSITSGISVDYYLEMPGEITGSNADSVDGNTAEWHESGREAYVDNQILATSNVPTFASIPGFTVIGAVVAILFSIGIAGLRARG